MKTLCESERIRLRKFVDGDLFDYYQMTRDPAIKEYVPHACPENIEEAVENITIYSNGDFIHDFYIVIEKKENHQMIGAIIATELLNKNLEVCMMIAPDFRRKGYMTEALKLFSSIIPRNFTLVFAIKSDNTASLNTVSKIENIREGDFSTDGITGMCYRFFYL